MKIGLNGVPVVILYPSHVDAWQYQAGPEAILQVIQRADALGYEWVSTGDDIFITPEAAETMGPRWSEVVSTLSFFAGATTRLKVLSNVLVPPHKNPIVLAKALATLDFLSGGRLLLGIGIGGSVPRGFEVFKIPRAERGPMTDEFIRAAKELWTKDRPSYHGKYVSFDDIVFEPKPVQKPHPPIWIGGNSRGAMRRAAALGDGYITWQSTPEELPEWIEYMRGQPDFGDPRRPFEVVVFGYKLQVERDTHRLLGPPVIPASREEWHHVIGSYERAGATGVSVSLGHSNSLEHFLEKMDWFAQEVLPSFKDNRGGDPAGSSRHQRVGDPAGSPPVQRRGDPGGSPLPKGRPA